MKKLIVITGPTACGKTDLSIQVAKQLNTEIVSCDSRQFYKEMSIGTAKPSVLEMDGIPHHFIDSHSITEEINAGEFERQALPIITSLFKKNDYVILCGGSGLFIDAITNGFDEMPSIKPELRTSLRETFTEKGILPLQEQLKSLDPDYFNEMDSDNPQRVIRALEICLSSEKNYSQLRKGQKEKRPFQIIKFVIDRPREELYNRINLRVDLMIQNGLINEVKSLLPYKNLNSLNTVGYKEIFDHLNGTILLNEATELVQRNSRRYAKRQLTWFRRDPSYIWIQDTKPHLIIDKL